MTDILTGNRAGANHKYHALGRDSQDVEREFASEVHYVDRGGWLMGYEGVEGTERT